MKRIRRGKKMNKQKLEENMVDWFAKKSKKVLAQNRHKKNWRELPYFLIGKLYEETDEVADALEKFKADKKMVNNLIKECNDVAVIAMMIADKAVSTL